MKSICKKNTIVGLLVFIFSLSTVAEAQISIYEDNQIDVIFKEWDQKASPGCAVGVYYDGEMIFSKGYGEAILEQDVAITPQTVFYSGSISKQFTAAAIALLSVRGDLDLDRPIRYYIPEIAEYADGRQPTVRQLVHHTSGFPDLYSLLRLLNIRLSDGVPAEEFVKVIVGQSHLNFEPGSKYLYSNSGYTLLSELVERLSGQTFREFTKENLFEPLGMDNTHFHDNHNHAIDNQALSYRPDDEKFRLSYLSSFEGVGPGGLYTTVEDMMKWNQQLYKNRLPNAEGLNKLLHKRGVLNNGDTLSYAFGLRIDKYKGQKSVGHSGSFMGFKAHYLRLPEQKYGSAILCNLGNINPTHLNKELADIFLKSTIEEWLDEYEGTYYNEELDLEYTLSVKDANLYLDREMSPSGKLTYIDDILFRTGGWEVEFRKSSTGEIESFTLSSGRVKNMHFEKL